MSPKFIRIRRPLFIELTFCLVTFLFLVPQPYLTVAELDASWQATLEEAFFKQWEFGTTINFTGGPLSFLYTPTSLGHYPYGQVFAESLVLATSLFLIFRALRGQPIWHLGIISLAIIPCIAIGKDAIYLASVTSSTFLLRVKSTRLTEMLLPAFMAVLALMKFSFASLAIVCLITLAMGALLQKERLSAMLPIGSFVGCFLLLWIAVGQNPLTIPSYFVNSLHISQGYLWNMHLHEEFRVFSYLLFFLVISSAPIFLATLVNRRTANAWLTLVIAAASIYLSWKAGITRGGTHMSIFMLTAIVTCFLVQPSIASKKWSHIWIALLTITYISGLVWVYPQGYKTITERVPRVLLHNLKFLSSPKYLNHHYTRLVPVVKSQRQLPNFQEQIQDGTVDVLHYQQAIALLNPFNFRPRPTVQNYPAYSQTLCQLNLDHVQNNPPDFIIVKSRTIDARYPFTDDSLYNREVFQNYRPTIREKEYLLLKKREHPVKITTDSVAIEKTVTHGQPVDINEWKEDLLWLQVDYQPSFWHRFFAFFYKPEMLHIKVRFDDDSEEFFRLVGGNLAAGFLLNPFLANDSDLETFLNTHLPEKKIKEFSIHTVPGHTMFNTHSYGIKLSILKSEATR